MIARMTAARIVCVLAAVAVCAWFALAIRASHAEDVVQSLLNTHPRLTAAQARAADSELDAAAFLNPDEAIDATRTIVDSRAGDLHGAIALALATARAHPQDATSWVVLEYLVAGGVNPRLHRIAAAHSQALVPPVVVPGR
jgi:hypothetical protein